MNLVLDSEQPLDDVLRVISAMYKVRVVAEPELEPEPRRSRSRKTPTNEIRQWALSQGMSVGANGRLPQSVLAAWKRARG